MHRVIGILSIPLFAITVICAGCSGTHSALNSAVAQPSQSTDTGWPTTLPIDGAQPWEVLDAAGCVVPLSRQASAVGAGSEFAAGVERYASSVAGVSDNGEACRLTSGDTGSGEVSWAWWRLTMGGQQPGVVSTDVNLLPMSDGGLSAYYLGLGDYAAGQWQWRGPFSGSHVRLSTAADVAAGSDFLSPLGNLFICVVACSGATFDVVGVAANPLDGADTQAPPVPAGLTATAIADGLQLGWQEVIAGDLAGYRVYFLDNWFHDQQGTGVRQRTFLEGRSGCLLSGLVGETFVRVSAVDLSGNESALSELVIAVPLAGEMPEVTLTASAPSGMLSEGISLSAAGAESYDWDLDGDGTYDVTGDTTGTAEADTSATGIIRPAVRGMNDGGSAVALGAVSLLVAGNARPVASAYADPSYGPATLAVTFTGEASDPDGEIVLYSWDFTGDGTYDWSDPVDTTPPVQYYGTPHLYNVKLRVDDDQGAFDVDTVTVLIEPAVDDNLPPVARLTTAVDGVNPGEQLTLFASDSSDPDGMIVDYEWDLNSNGVFNETGNDEEDARGYTVAHVRRSNPGLHTVALRVTDDDGASDTVEFVFVVHGWVIRTVIDDDVWRFIDMEIVSGHPAISFYFESFTSEDLRYVRADDDLGLTWGSEVLVDSDWQTDSGWNSNLEVVNGYPAIAYRVQESSGDWNLKFARAEDVNGDSWADPEYVDNGGDTTYYADMEVVAGNPAICYNTFSPDRLNYVRAADSLGTSWGSSTTVDSTDTGDHCSLCIVDGWPAIAYRCPSLGELRYVRATNATGTGWDTPDTVDGGPANSCSNVSLHIAAGQPAISYTYDDGNHELRFIRASDAVGASWQDPLILDDSEDMSNGTSLWIIDGVPAISYHRQTSEDLMYVSAGAPGGGVWDSPTTAVDGPDAGYSSCLRMVHGFPAIAYTDISNSELMYAIGF